MTTVGLVRWVTTVLEPLRWQKHRREHEASVAIERLHLRLERQRQKDEAAANARREEAERQSQLIESLFDNLRDIDERRSNDLRQLAAGVTEQAKGFQQWIGLFAQTPGDPRSTTVRDEDEWAEEQKRLSEHYAALGYPVAESPMAQLEFLLNDDDV